MSLINVFRSWAEILEANAANKEALPEPKPTPVLNYLDYSVGNITEKYETSNRGPGYISDGSKWGDPGGDSYGAYQLESKLGTLQEYLKTNDAFTKELKDLVINSKEFKHKWVELAASDPKGFRQSQFNYLAQKPSGYVDAYNYAKGLGWAVTSFAMQSAIYSTVNQSGGWKHGIFDKSAIRALDPVLVQINKLYDARAVYFKTLNIGATIKKNIIQQRTVLERADVIKLIEGKL